MMKMSIFEGAHGNPVEMPKMLRVSLAGTPIRASTIVFSLTTERNSQECQVKEDHFQKE